MYQFCVSGAAKGESVEEGRHLAKQMGVALAKAGHTLMTGATIGLPNYAAEGYKEAGGKMSLGISPAASKVEHILKYHLPTEAYDVILYSGLHYVGRDTLLISSSDAVLSIGGRLGTLHEFTISIETDTPIGFLHGAGGVTEEIKHLLEISKPHRNGATVLFSDSADQLIKDLEKHLNQEHAKYRSIYN
ncbi:MAG: SLOG cluster 4 domain-containing protein [Candidatus Saccharimonadales bacterium]